MKQTKLLLPLIFCILSVLTLINACTKTETPNTTASVPVLTTTSASSITQTSVQTGGIISSDGGASVTEKGVCWSTSPNPTTSGYKTNEGSGTTSFVSSITGLITNTTYYARAYATNNSGTAYGNEISLTTQQNISFPVLTTTAITSITQSSAVGGGEITSDGGATIIARGVCWSTSQNPTILNTKTNDGTGRGAFTSSLTVLLANTTYYVRAYGTNSNGTSYGAESSFTTQAVSGLAILTTTPASNVSWNTAQSGGNISAQGSTVVTARGVCWSSTNNNPTIADQITSNGTGVGTFTSNLTNLTTNTTYYARAYATNGSGTAYGNVVSLTTLPAITDADGNVYNTVTIGTQVWLVENLKTTKYRNGDPIPNVTDNAQWGSVTSGAYSNYGNNASNATVNGRLYNLYAVNDSRNISPTGFHVPTAAEWIILKNYLNSPALGCAAGDCSPLLMKTSSWGGNNTSGFTALPSGERDSGGNFIGLGTVSNWWSLSTTSVPRAYWHLTTNNSDGFTQYTNINSGNTFGYSVRCVKD